MKASESIANYDIKVREYTNYAIKSIKNCCKNFGPRPTGSEAEKNAQEYMMNDLNNFCDEVTREEFKVSDKAFMSWIRIGVIMAILGIISFTLGFFVVSAVLFVAILLMIALEFGFYKPILDVFFKKKTAGNVYGVRKANGETKKRIILCAHTDSAFEWKYTYKTGRKGVAFNIYGAALCVLASIGVSVYATITNGAFSDIVWLGDGLVTKILAVALYLTLIIYFFNFSFINYKLPVTGAIDNLSGVFISNAVAKYLNDNDIRFENTEVCVLLTGAEEAGLRGSKSFVKNHPELKNSNVETVVVGIDTICELEFMKVYSKDMNGLTKNDERVAKLIQDGAKNAGFDVPTGTIELGATDAAAFSQKGISAATFVAMNPEPSRYYHTRLDTVEMIKPQAIDAGVKIALETVFLYDEKGI
ncbi:MAG: M20/M25/M40 family metallo-hydrolase [Clostridia bacterium]|nr:M20/M25/M40 family metallo-hydrolase [Clostridia bacterium]